MIIKKEINCKEFSICAVSTNELCVFENNSPGIMAQYLYVYSGEADIEAGGKILRKKGKNFYSLEEYLNQPLTVSKLYSDSFSWVTINLLDQSWLFDAEFLQENTNLTITPADKRKYIICINGKIQCNDKELASLKYAQILPGKTVDIQVPEGSVGLVLTRR